MTPEDYVARLLLCFPKRWSGDPSCQPGGQFYGLLLTYGTLLAENSAQIDYTKLQSRIATATDTNLEAIANDFFGPGFPRAELLDASGTNLVPESDSAYSARIRAEIVAPGNTLAAIQAAVTEYVNTYYTAQVVGQQRLLGLDTAGGIGTVGGLDGRAKDTPSIPKVSTFDRQSNLRLSNIVGLTSGQFCILLTYGITNATGFFMGRSYLNRGTYLTSSNLQIIQPPTPELDAVVQKTKAYAFKQIYCDDRGAI